MGPRADRRPGVTRRAVTPRSYGAYMETATPLPDTPPSDAAPTGPSALPGAEPVRAPTVTATVAPSLPEQPRLPLEPDPVAPAETAGTGPASAGRPARSPAGAPSSTTAASASGGGVDPDTVEVDAPIGFALTARARRAVAPSTLPELSVVGGTVRPVSGVDAGGALEEPGDTRPARARALRRAGVPVAAIAAQLGSDALAVTAWVGEVSASRRTAPVAAEVSGSPASATADTTAGASAGTAAGQERELLVQEVELAHQLARADAAGRARHRLVEDAPFAVAAGLLAATAAADAHAVTLTAADPRTLARVLDLLRAEEPRVATLARVVLRVGPAAAGDLLRHRVAGHLGVDVDRVAWTRWKHAPDPSGVQVLVRVADPTLAATVAGWIDAVLEPDLEPVDLAF